MNYMVFFIHQDGTVIHTAPINTFNAAIEAAKAGPRGAYFMLTDISNRNHYREIFTGYVP